MPLILATVPLAGGSRLSPSKLGADFTSWDDVLAPPSIEKAEGTLSFEHGDFWVAIGMVPSPIPGSLKDSWEGCWLWPDAAKDLARQKGHLIITARGSTEDADEVELRKFLTQVVASILATTEGALGVFWGTWGHIISRSVFLDMAKSLLPDEAPLLLWVDFRVGPVDHESGLSQGFTTGMNDLGLMDLVTENATESPSELRDRLMSIAEYLLNNGLVIEDGHTVGGSAEEQIKVLYGPSPFGHEEQVMRLDYMAKAKKKGWFNRGN